jgi:hypothetical protein
MFKRRTAARDRNILGRAVNRGQLSIDQVLGLPKEKLLDLLDMGYQLPIAGGTQSSNQQAENPIYFPKAIVVSSDQTINQGDAVWWDSVNYTLKPCTSYTQIAVGTTGGFCGVAGGDSNAGVYPTPPSGQSEALPGIVVQSGGTAWFNTGTAETLNPFQVVTIGADAQTITGYNVETTADRIGFVIVPPPVAPRGASGATPVPETTGGGARARVWIERKFPTTALL